MTVNYNSPIPPMPKAEPVRLNQVYSKVVKVSPPSDALRKLLKNDRGLTDEQIDLFIAAPIDNRTIVRNILEDGSIQPKDLLGVPGFYLDRTGNGVILPKEVKSAYIFDSECTIAVRDEQGRIIALQSRICNSDDGSRYRWYSSKNKPHGVTSGSPMGVVPGKGLQSKQAGHHLRIAVCEGFFKAAAIARSLDVDYVIFVNGIQNTTSFPSQVRRIAYRQSFSILIVPDMDFLINKEVMKAYAKLVAYALDITQDVMVLAWPTELGKGYDDLLLSGDGGCCKVRPVGRFRDALCNEAARIGDPKLMNYINNYFHGRI